MIADDLWKRWTTICIELGVLEGPTQSMWDQLVARYSEQHRRYHTLDHLRAMFQTLAEFEERFSASDTVYLAVFFHDAIYDSSSTSNEKDSAVLARQFLSEHAVDSDIVESVESLILATASHIDETSVADADWILDADLAILAAESDRYTRYAQAIREEYASVSDDAFRAGRQQFLETILLAETLYRTKELKTRFESRARANLQRELDALRANPG